MTLLADIEKETQTRKPTKPKPPIKTDRISKILEILLHFCLAQETHLSVSLKGI